MNWSKVSLRKLFKSERNILSSDNNTPLIIEPSQVSKHELNEHFISDFFRENSAQILQKITEHGAVLLRNFPVKSESDFEKVITHIKGMNGMKHYFLSEVGRDIKPGTKLVYYTNKIYKTGGTLKFGTFHTENFYSCDVPRYINFCCLKPSWLGGETGLVHMGRVYKELPDHIKLELNDRTFLTGVRLVSEIAERYNINEERVKDICTNFGLTSSVTKKGEDVILFYKPTVLIHPETNEANLICSVSGELGGLDAALLSEFINSYKGVIWTLHRLCWRFPILISINELKWKDLKNIKKTISNFALYFKEQVRPNPPSQTYRTEKLKAIFTDSDIKCLAKSMRSNFYSFKWKKGDILLIDNLQMAHSGMPGFGKRILRVILCNPLPMNHLSTSPGCQKIYDKEKHESLASIMNRSK